MAEGAPEKGAAAITASGREIALYLDVNLDVEEPKFNLSYRFYYLFSFCQLSCADSLGADSISSQL
jgi:hypothetical protein